MHEKPLEVLMVREKLFQKSIELSVLIFRTVT